MKQTMTLAGILLTITLSLASCNFNGNSDNSKKANINNADRNTDRNIRLTSKTLCLTEYHR